MARAVDTIYIVHHSHTDIGYTHDQPIIWELHRRFLDQALHLAWADRDRDGDDVFRWTAETTGPLLAWLEQASDEALERFRLLNHAGRIAVGAMLFNITPLYDTAQLIESLRAVNVLRRRHGLRVRHAMNCDVNGENWPLVDLLLDAGIEGFSMAINEHFGGSPFRRPNAFWWEGPSGRRLLAWNGWSYNIGHEMGIGWDAEGLAGEWWPRIETHLAAVEYPLPILMVQMYHPFGDNGPANPRIAPFVGAWNAAGRTPRLRMSTLSEWFDALHGHGDQLPVHRGDWTDYWNFGCISSAREQGINRESRVRLLAADSLRAVAGATAGAPLPGEKGVAETAGLRDAAWDALHLFDEHTWGADVSVHAPESDDTRVQWTHKAGYAAQARSLSMLLQRDALAALTRQVEAATEPALLVFNPLPWPRRAAGPVSNLVLEPRGGADDPTAGRHFQDRVEIKPRHWLPPTELPAFGYRTVPLSALLEAGDDLGRSSEDFLEDAVVENHRYRLHFDSERGGVISWWDKELQRELVDGEGGWPLGSFAYETIADPEHPWPRRLLWRGRAGDPTMAAPRGWRTGWRARRRGAQEVLTHRVWPTPLAIEVEQRLRVEALPAPIRVLFHLPLDADHIEYEAAWEMGLTTAPEATYLAFPLAVPGAVAHLDLGGQAMQPERDQLPGTCRDYYTVQRWVDFSNDEYGITVATPINPMVQLGGFRFGANLAEHTLPRALFLGWITNNYWETNFRAHQPGRVAARYWLRPHAGPFDEAAAHRFGLEAASPPLMQFLGEPRAAPPLLPPAASLLRLPTAPTLVLHIRPSSNENELVLVLAHAADTPGRATIGPAAFRFGSAYLGDLFGNEREPLSLAGAEVQLALGPREIATVVLGELARV